MASTHEGDSEDLRIVLLGVSGAGKTSIGNAILDRDAFKESRTRESEKQRGRVEDRNISIIDTPGFFNPHLTDEELKKQMMKSLDLSDPGPHVFLLVINLEDFIENERNVVEQIQENFGAQVFKFTLVLFTGREQMSRKDWMVFILSTRFLELVSHFRENYHVINSENENDEISELRQKIDDFVKQNNHQIYNNAIYSFSPTKSIRIKKKQEEKNTYKRKEQETKQTQDKTAHETLITHRVKEERTTRAVIEQIKERTSQKKQHAEENTYREKKREKEVRQERAEIKSETFEIQSATEERKTQTVIQEKQESIVYFSQTKKSTHRDDVDNNSLGTPVNFSDETMGDTNVIKTTKKSRVIRHKGTFNPQRSEDELRIVLVGKTGAGKSATGNTIIGLTVFDEKFSSESVTKECQKYQKIVQGKDISVIDTPGLFDTSISEDQLKKEIEKCVEMSVPGPHAFLLVIRLDVRFTDEEKDAVKWIQKNFGEEAARYTIVLFTRGDLLDTTIEEFLIENKQINDLVKQCKGGYHVFNNKYKDKKQTQVTKLLQKIDGMVTENGGKHYTNEMYEKAQKKIMIKNVKDAALVGASVAGVGVAVAGGAILVTATGGFAVPAALLAGGAALTGGSGAAKAIASKLKHSTRQHNKEKTKNTIWHAE